MPNSDILKKLRVRYNWRDLFDLLLNKILLMISKQAEAAKRVILLINAFVIFGGS